MDAVIIEKPDESPIETNVVQDEQQEEVKVVEGEKQPEETSQTQEEATFDVDGEKLTATQIKEYKLAADNKAKWEKANTERAQELAQDRKRLERYSLLEEAVQKNPEALKALFQPPAPARNMDADLQAHYNQKPADIFSPEFSQWEMKRDQLISERAANYGRQEARSEILADQAKEHNERVGLEIEKKLREKGRSQDEIYQLGKYVMENFKTRDGKYDASQFELAEQHFFGQDMIRQTKIDTARQTSDAITKAKPAGQVGGVTKTTDLKTESEKADDDFTSQIRERFAPR